MTKGTSPEAGLKEITIFFLFGINERHPIAQFLRPSQVWAVKGEMLNLGVGSKV